MESKLHKTLKEKAYWYLLNKGYWVTKKEMDCGYYGISDVWGIKPSNFSSMNIEVKISRADWRNNKRKERLVDEESMIPDYGKLLNKYMPRDERLVVPAEENYILCPAGLIQPEEVDKNWGLLWYKNDRLRNKRKPKYKKVHIGTKMRILINFLDNTYTVKT